MKSVRTSTYTVTIDTVTEEEGRVTGCGPPPGRPSSLRARGRSTTLPCDVHRESGARAPCKKKRRVQSLRSTCLVSQRLREAATTIPVSSLGTGTPESRRLSGRPVFSGSDGTPVTGFGCTPEGSLRLTGVSFASLFLFLLETSVTRGALPLSLGLDFPTSAWRLLGLGRRVLFSRGRSGRGTWRRSVAVPRRCKSRYAPTPRPRSASTFVGAPVSG